MNILQNQKKSVMQFNKDESIHPKTVTVDGPAGAGKSTIAKELAKRLGFSYIDTGAMYRALTFKAMQVSIDLNDEQKLVELAGQTTIDLVNSPNGIIVNLDGQDVSSEIRSVEVTNNTFYIARAPRVRQIMVKWQRSMGLRKNVVIEGRDVGTVVFPNADYKFYLDADLDERSNRRIKELREKGKIVEADILKEEMRQRDHKDLNREAGPLKRADDAILIDSTHLTIEQVVEKILSLIIEN